MENKAQSQFNLSLFCKELHTKREPVSLAKITSLDESNFYVPCFRQNTMTHKSPNRTCQSVMQLFHSHSTATDKYLTLPKSKAFVNLFQAKHHDTQTHNCRDQSLAGCISWCQSAQHHCNYVTHTDFLAKKRRLSEVVWIHIIV